eukprot:GHVU01108660.1.p1 GENE.GHVU01108660.1~~GHVU01108660.1.p1  ORF type:complete len:373 (+),score=88.04 GHVU01108660.1:331-1449(+)
MTRQAMKLLSQEGKNHLSQPEGDDRADQSSNEEDGSSDKSDAKPRGFALLEISASSSSSSDEAVGTRVKAQPQRTEEGSAKKGRRKKKKGKRRRSQEEGCADAAENSADDDTAHIFKQEFSGMSHHSGNLDGGVPESLTDANGYGSPPLPPTRGRQRLLTRLGGVAAALDPDAAFTFRRGNFRPSAEVERVLHHLDRSRAPPPRAARGDEAVARKKVKDKCWLCEPDSDWPLAVDRCLRMDMCADSGGAPLFALKAVDEDWYSLYLSVQTDFDAVVGLLQGSPFHPYANCHYAYLMLLSGEEERARVHVRRALYGVQLSFHYKYSPFASSSSVSTSSATLPPAPAAAGLSGNNAEEENEEEEEEEDGLMPTD